MDKMKAEIAKNSSEVHHNQLFMQQNSPSTKQIYISSNTEKLDLTFVHTCLIQTPWAKNRTLADQQKIIDNSLNYGMYEGEQQIGYARLLTDYVFMAYVLDVVIAPDYRGKGLGLKLMRHIVEDDRLRNIQIWRLGTDDAHRLYEKVGFKPIAKPEKLMEINKRA